MHSIPSSTKADILSLLQNGCSYSQIHHATGVSRPTISRICSKHLPHLSHTPGGRPQKLSPTNLHYAQRLITTGKADTAPDVVKHLAKVTSSTVSAQSMRRYLRKLGMKAVVKAKKPLLTQRHKKARLEFAEAHQHWTLEDWKKVIWSDETKINYLGSDKRKWA